MSKAFSHWVVGAALVMSACGGTLQCREEEGQERCVTTGGLQEGAAAAVGAGALWVTAGGCKLAGCHPPMECNQRTELCEPIRCTETLRRCPDGFSCDPESHTCR